MRPKRTSDVTADQLRAARGQRTQQQAADILGVSRRQYIKYEAGTVAIRPDMLAALQTPTSLPQ